MLSTLACTNRRKTKTEGRPLHQITELPQENTDKLPVLVCSSAVEGSLCLGGNESGMLRQPRALPEMVLCIFHGDERRPLNSKLCLIDVSQKI